MATIASPVALNAINLYRLSTDRLGLVGPAALALPVTLDGAALVALLVRLRALRDGDSAPGASLAVLVFAGVSSWLAAVEGWTVGGAVGALALGVLPVVAVVMLDLTVASVRRSDARDAGLLPGRAPVYSALRWVLAPISTARAWRYGVLWEVSDRTLCLAATAATTVPSAVPQSDRLVTWAGDAARRNGSRPPHVGPHGPHVPERPEEADEPVGPLAGHRVESSPSSHSRWDARDASDVPLGSDGLHVSDVPSDVAPGPRASAAPAGPEVPPRRGAKRAMIRRVIGTGLRSRADVVAECARLGVVVSEREVSRVLTEHSVPSTSTLRLGVRTG